MDDDLELLESMVAVLADHFSVRACVSGPEALRAMDTEAFDVVCTDWLMPGMDGIEFFRSVVERNHAPEPSFVLMTAYASELLDQIPYPDRTLLGLLRKPFSPDHLLQCISEFGLLARQRREALAATSEGSGED